MFFFRDYTGKKSENESVHYEGDAIRHRANRSIENCTYTSRDYYFAFDLTGSTFEAREFCSIQLYIELPRAR